MSRSHSSVLGKNSDGWMQTKLTRTAKSASFTKFAPTVCPPSVALATRILVGIKFVVRVVLAVVALCRLVEVGIVVVVFESIGAKLFGWTGDANFTTGVTEEDTDSGEVDAARGFVLFVGAFFEPYFSFCHRAWDDKCSNSADESNRARRFMRGMTRVFDESAVAEEGVAVFTVANSWTKNRKRNRPSWSK